MDIEALIQRGESENVEFKESLMLKDEIGKTVSAFANHRGGAVLVGINDRGESLGVDIGSNTLEELANYIKKNTDPAQFPSIKTASINDKTIVVMEITAGGEKPVLFKGRAWRRVGRTNQLLSSSEIRALARESSKFYWDEQICERATLEDIDGEKVKWFLRKAKVERNIDVDLETPAEEVLDRLNLICSGKLTNATLLLFARNPQKFFIQSEVRCARFKGTKPLKPFIDMKVFSGNIIDQVDKVVNFVLEHIPLAAWVVPGKIERKEKYAYPPDAVREAVINAICHRDYESPSNVQARVFDDRVEIWNPGKLPEGWTVETLKQKHESKPFNPLIADQFFLIRFIEKWGTGINDMIAKCVEWGLPEPEFELSGTSLVVTFRRSLLTEESLRGLGLNDRQIKIIKYLRKGGYITSSEYVEMFGITGRQARMDLSQLVSTGLILKIGKARQTKYRFNPEISGNIRKE